VSITMAARQHIARIVIEAFTCDEAMPKLETRPVSCEWKSALAYFADCVRYITDDVER
jgi:hypothetical protein